MTTTDYILKRCVFETTLACDLKCMHCGSRAGRRRPDELELHEIEGLFAALKALSCGWLTLSGGEPMTRPDWAEIVLAASRAGLRAGMITNALAFDGDAARLSADNGLEAVSFSLDGASAPTHDFIRNRVGHFARIRGAMDAARAAGLPFGVITHLNRRNHHEIEAIHDLVTGEGAFAWQVQLGTDMGNMRDHPEILLAPESLPGIEAALARCIRRGGVRVKVSDSIGYYGPHERTLRRSTGVAGFTGCKAGVHVLGIESNGNVKGCLSIMAGYNDAGAAYVEGNIRETSLVDLWRDPNSFAYNRRWSAESLGGACGECKRARRCRGGCLAKRVASGGGLENPFCVYRILEDRAPRDGVSAGRAAAIVLASLLGASTQACSKVADTQLPDGGMDAGDDAGADSDTDTDTPTDDGTDYSDPGPTDTDTPTDEVTDYSDPGPFDAGKS